MVSEYNNSKFNDVIGPYNTQTASEQDAINVNNADRQTPTNTPEIEVQAHNRQDKEGRSVLGSSSYADDFKDCRDLFKIGRLFIDSLTDSFGFTEKQAGDLLRRYIAGVGTEAQLALSTDIAIGLVDAVIGRSTDIKLAAIRMHKGDSSAEINLVPCNSNFSSFNNVDDGVERTDESESSEGEISHE